MLLLAGPVHVFDFVAVADMLVNAVPSGSGLDIIEDRWSVSDGAIFFPWVPWEAELDESVGQFHPLRKKGEYEVDIDSTSS
jgi:hypothetical protein